jgi:error-prone DNA polymerase
MEVRGPDVNASEAQCTVEAVEPVPVVRLGLGYVLGVREDEVRALVATREEGGPFRSLADLASRAGAGRPSLDRLAWAGACDSLAPDGARRTALWQLGVTAPGVPIPGARGARLAAGGAASPGTQLSLPLAAPEAPPLAALAPWDAMVADYASTGLTLGPHPLELVRPHLDPDVVSIADLERLPHDSRVRLGGLVVARQRPGTAKGIVFLLLEDEFGTVNLVIPPDLYEANRLTVRGEPLVLCEGRLERLPVGGGAINVFVKGIRPLVAPGQPGAEVVELAERRITAAATGRGEGSARPLRDAEADGGGSGRTLGDFREVAPAVQSFASGRRR